MFKKILVPIDVSQSDSGKAGMKAAAELAGKTGASLVLLNVTGDVPNLVANLLPSNYLETMQASAREELEKLASSHGLAAGTYEVQTGHGQIYHEILSVAKSSGCDLIVVTSHKPELSDYLLGSAAGKVVRHAQCSVLVVRP